jgi:predicted  nucleic acid-binding Zn-ribbon protein
MRWLPSFVLSLRELVIIKDLLRHIMTKLDDLNQKVTDLQTALDAEQEQIQTAIASLQQTITDLQGQLGGAATDTELQAVIDRLDAVKTDLAGTIPDAPAES